MTEEVEEATASRRRRRSTGGGRRGRVGGAELVVMLDEQVDKLIQENRRLKRELDKLSAGVTSAASSAVERTLRSLNRKVQRAVGSAPVNRRRRAASPASSRNRTRARASSGAE